MNYSYCPVCGRELIKKDIKDEGLINYCAHCNKPYFFLGRVCVLVVIINEDKEIALSKQNHIVENKWILISGYIKQGETVEDTVVREVWEETGLKVQEFKYVKSYYIKEMDMIMLGYQVFVKKGHFRPSDEIQEIAWFPVDEALKNILENSIAEQLLLEIKDTIQ